MRIVIILKFLSGKTLLYTAKEYSRKYLFHFRLLVQDGTAFSYIDISRLTHLKLLMRLKDRKWNILMDKLRCEEKLEYTGIMDSSTEALAFLSLTAVVMELTTYIFVASVKYNYKNPLLGIKDGVPAYLIGNIN